MRSLAALLALILTIAAARGHADDIAFKHVTVVDVVAGKLIHDQLVRKVIWSDAQVLHSDSDQSTGYGGVFFVQQSSQVGAVPEPGPSSGNARHGPVRSGRDIP